MTRWLIALLALMAASPVLAGNTASGSASAMVVDAVVFAHDAGASLQTATFYPGKERKKIRLASDSYTLRGSAHHAYTVLTSGAELRTVDGAVIALDTAAQQWGQANQVAVRIGGNLVLTGGEKAGLYSGSYRTLISYD